MGEVESIAHSGIEGPDTRAMQEFYENIFGGTRVEMVSRSYEGSRGGNPHPCGIVGDYLFVIFPDRDRGVDSPTAYPPENQLTGGTESNPRHAFSVSRDRFQEVLAHLRASDVPFQGPIAHPESGPLGESVYFKDPGHNFYEICWRRDADAPYAPVPVSAG